MSEETISVSQYFECPDCKGDVLDEIQTDVVLSSHITDIYSEDQFSEAQYANSPEWDGGVVDRYQCARCGWTVKDDMRNRIEHLGDLFEWLKEHKKRRDEK